MPFRSLEQVTVHPTLADVLASEFVLPFDADLGICTLGRMMTDAYLFGEGPIVPEPEELRSLHNEMSICAYRHWPTFAPEIVVSGYASLEGVYRGGIRLRGLALETQETSLLRILEDGSNLSLAVGDEIAIDVPLQHGSRLAIMRKMVTHRAQDFIEQAFIAQSLRRILPPPSEPE